MLSKLCTQRKTSAKLRIRQRFLTEWSDFIILATPLTKYCDADGYLKRKNELAMYI